MYTYKYPRPAVTADIVLIDRQRRMVLLIERGNDPFKGCWAFPGCFFDMSDPDIEHTAARELEEETSLTGLSLRLATVASREGRDPRGRTVTAVFTADVDSQRLDAKGGDDARLARWWSIDQLPPLAFDHEEILHKIV